jgi:hypothetical protein
MVAIVTVAFAAGPAEARHATARFFLDGSLGFGVPIADQTYRDAFFPSPKIGLHLGAEIWVARHFGVAPEIALDGGPLIGQVNPSSVTTGVFRFQPGVRLLFGFGNGHAFFLRWLIGGELFVFGPGGRGGANTLNLGFATEPGLGMQFKFARHAVAGFTLGFPIGVHTFGTPVTATNVDFDMSGFIGLRI